MPLPPDTVLLVPTPGERAQLLRLGLEEWPMVEVGFGLVSAGISAMQLFQSRRPSLAIVVGIAGSYDLSVFPVGSARWFGEIRVDGIGVGEGMRFQSPESLGFPQWRPADGDPVFDGIHVNSAPLTMLSVAAASADAEMAEVRRERHPTASGEDMESFSVAMAAAMAGVPLRVLRGCSNPVGDRDHARWRVAEALQSVAKALLDARGERMP